VPALGGCKTGEAKLTRGYDLKAKFVIHAVGPVWRGGTHGEPELLASCCRRSLEIASEHQLISIAFSAISTGIYGYPVEQAAWVAITTTGAFIQRPTSLHEVVFCCFSPADYRLYTELLVSSS